MQQQQQQLKSDLQTFVDAQLSLAGRTGVFCISEPVHAEWDETASQNKSGEGGSRHQERHSLIKCRYMEEPCDKGLTHRRRGRCRRGK